MATLRSIIRHSGLLTSIRHCSSFQSTRTIKSLMVSSNFNAPRNFCMNSAVLQTETPKRSGSNSKQVKVNALAQITLVYKKEDSTETCKTITYGDAVKLSKRLSKVLVPVKDMDGNISPGEFSLENKSQGTDDLQNESDNVSKSKRKKIMRITPKIEASHLEMKIDEMIKWLQNGKSIFLEISKPRRSDRDEEQLRLVGKRLIKDISRGVEKFGHVTLNVKTSAPGAVQATVKPKDTRNSDRELKPLAHDQLKKKWTKRKIDES